MPIAIETERSIVVPFIDDSSHCEVVQSIRPQSTLCHWRAIAKRFEEHQQCPEHCVLSSTIDYITVITYYNSKLTAIYL